MTLNLSISEKLAHSTVRIECEIANGQVRTGTGFFFHFAKFGDIHVPAIITNKHVVAGAVKGRFHMTLADAAGLPIAKSRHIFQLDGFEHIWIPHPESDVDLCVMPFAPLQQLAAKENRILFYLGLDQSLIPTKAEFEEMVLMEEDRKSVV